MINEKYRYNLLKYPFSEIRLKPLSHISFYEPTIDLLAMDTMRTNPLTIFYEVNL